MPTFAHVKGWKDFQHYKDRSPPWVKLHRSLLDNFEFQCLPLASKALAPMLWLLAAESNDGSFRADADWLAFRLRWSEADVSDGLKPLCDAGFVVLDSSALADCLQDAPPETETETETEKTMSSGDDARAETVDPPHAEQIPYTAIVATYHERLPMLPQVRKLSDPRRRKLRARWREDRERQSLAYWDGFFAYVAQSDFLTGRSGKWVSCDFEWLIESGNHLKIIEGKYENREAA